MKRKHFVLAGISAFLFIPVFAAAPAQADWVVGIGNVTGSCVQFDWRGGTATYSGSGNGQFTVDVNNTIDNRIGGGSQPDHWSIWVNNQMVVASDVIEQSQVSVPVSGDWTVTVQGIDRGFWAGWYGTIFCNPSFAPDVPLTPPIPTGDYSIGEGGANHIVAPAGQVIDNVSAWYGDPNDGSQGADESAQYTAQLHGLAEADLVSSNQFGDPVPGVGKVLVATVTYMPAPTPAPVLEPTPSVEPSATPEPVITPTPIETPSIEPTALPEPTPATTDVRTEDVRTVDVRPAEPEAPSPEPTPSAPIPEPARQPDPQPEPATPTAQTPSTDPTPQIPQPESPIPSEPEPQPNPLPAETSQTDSTASDPATPPAEESAAPTPETGNASDAPVDPVTPTTAEPVIDNAPQPTPKPPVVEPQAKPITVVSPVPVVVDKPEVKPNDIVPSLPSNPTP
jgi:hypothetical protein